MPDPSTSEGVPGPERDPLPRFTAEEESELVAESNAQKADANKLFSAADFSQAISQYDKALASCPNYLDYEIAVIKSNVAACYLKLEDWKSAVDAASAALDCLERLIPKPKPKSSADDGSTSQDPARNGTASGENDAVVEIEGDDQEAEEALKRLELSDQRKEEIARIKAKSLMRRAKGKTHLGGWAGLQGAEDDYKTLATMPNLPPPDKKVVQAALRDLPLKVKEAREKEMGEMMGKLKELGNGILKPFGLSTDMFKVTKDEATGGYSMSMNQDN